MAFKYGRIPDLADPADLPFVAKASFATLPPKRDLRPNCPPIVNQGNLGSCTANAICSAHRFEQMRQGVVDHWYGSRLQLYYDERLAENTVRSDAGAQIRTGFKVIADKGIAPESMWPYNVSKFAETPPPPVYDEAKHNQTLKYRRVQQTREDIQSCISEGHPVVAGFTVLKSFERIGKDGLMSMPTGLLDRPVGGHAVLIVGYDNDYFGGRYIVMNSWGITWGDKGFFYAPYEYFESTRMAADFWMMSEVEVKDAPPVPIPTPTPTPTPVINFKKFATLNGVELYVKPEVEVKT